MKISHTLFILVVVVSLLSSTLLQNSAFAQMESLKITGYQYPEIDGVFNVNLTVEGSPRAAPGGIFNVQITIYEKDKPTWLMDQEVTKLYLGTNKLTIDLKDAIKPYKPNVHYILEVQHVAIISTFEFVPVDKSSGVSPPTIETKPAASSPEQLIRENEELKKQLQDKDDSICGEGTVMKDGKCVAAETGGGCLIATATFGSELSPQVQQLRELRDNYLMKTESGSSFMTGFNQFYYSFSPTIADLERQSPIFKEAVKLAITPLVTSLSILNYVDMNSEANVLGYGIGLILLNLGMYIVTPVGIGIVIARKF